MSQGKIFQQNRVLGCVSNHIPVVTRYIQQRKENLIVTCTGKSFHTYGCSHFNLLSVSGAHPEDISCLAADTFHVYAASGKKVFAWRRGNELKHIFVGHKYQVHLLLPFGAHLLSIDENSNLIIWDIKIEQIILESNFNNKVFKVTTLMHPATYVNKILLGSQQGALQLWNIKTMKMIYTFTGWNCAVNIIEQTPAIHVVGIGLIDGRIILHNLKLDTTVFKLAQDWGLVTSISFRSDGYPIMATGTLQGHVVLWNLEQRKIESQILNAHFDSVSGLKYLPNEPLLVSSSPDNSLKLWIFDLPDGAGRLLRFREGHAEPPTVIRFYGQDGHNILSISGDSSLRIFSTQTETFNKSLGRASYNRKSSKKKGRDNKDALIMPPMINFAAESTREKEWDNIATNHLGLGVVTTWSYHKLRMGEHKLLPEKFKFNMNITATALSITQCGNFVIIGYNSGHLERFNMQSGEHRATYGGEKGIHDGPVRGISVDYLNVEIVTVGRDKTIQFWPFKPSKDTQPKTVIKVKEPIEWIVSHKENSLIAIALQDFTIIIVDVSMRQIIRQFDGHTGQLTDATFSPDSRWLVTTSIDRTIRVWDIPSSKLIEIFQVMEACTSITFSPNGEFLATAHVCNLGICLWTNQTLYSHVSLKTIQSNEKISLISIPDTNDDNIVETDENEVVSINYVCPNQLYSKLITVSTLATSRWLNLLNIDTVKNRNKPSKALNASDAAPFFLPTISSLKLQFDFLDNRISKENNKLQIHPDFQNFTSLSQLLLNTINMSNYAEAVDTLKSMGPSAMDLEVQSLVFDVQYAIPMLHQLLKLIKYMLKSKQDFEVAQAFLSLVLKFHGPLIIQDDELAEYLEEIQKAQYKNWKLLRHKLFYSLSVVQHLKKT